MADAAVAAGGAARAAPIPGPAPDEIVVPVLDSIGVRLLMKMGWRHGRAVGPAHVSTGDKARRVARRAMLALARAGGSDGSGAAAEAMEAGGREGGERGEEEEEEEEELPPAPRSTPAYILQPKTDFHGLGFNPFRAAPEFRAAKRAKAGGSGGSGGGRGGRGKVRMGGGFGIGALEEVGVEDEDVYDAQDVPDFEIGGSDDEDEEEEGRRTAAGSRRRPVEEAGGAAMSASHALPGFRIAATTAANDIELFPPPVVPPSFVPVHTFAEPLRPATAAPPLPAAAPDSPSLLAAVQGMAAFIARGGRAAEALARERHAGDPLFAFLSGGEGADYYRRRVWEAQQAAAAMASSGSSSLAQPLDDFGGQGEGRGRRHRLDAQGRGEMLGERPLKHEPVAAPVAPSVVPAEDIARVQAQLASQFTRGHTQDMDATAACVPYAGEPAKQARYEAFVVEREKGSLSQRQDGSGASGEAAEFERTWRMLRGPGATQTPVAIIRPADGTASELSVMLGSRFASASVEVSAPLPTGLVTAAQAQALLTAPTASSIENSSAAKSHPWREEVAWRPNSLLCRRFSIPDPYAGKAPPPAKPRSRTESFTLGSGAAAVESPALLGALALPAPPSSPPANVVEELLRSKDSDEAAPQSFEPLPEKPIDLYKAIFSDEDSDVDEAEGGLAVTSSSAVTAAGPAGPEQSEAAVASAVAGAALNRLVAGDFLESLGKELGLDVPTPEAAAAAGLASSAAQQLAASQARRDKERRRAAEPSVRDLAEGKAAAFFRPAAAGPGAAGPATVDGRGGAALGHRREATIGELQEERSSAGLLGLAQASGSGRDTEKAVGTGTGKSAPSGSRSGSGSSSSSSLLDSSEVEREQRRRRRQERKCHKERKERRHGKRRSRSGSKKSAKLEEGASSKNGRGHKEERRHKRRRRRSHKEVLVGAA
eukprot:SM000066S20420  [mRNA]  locus=s66:246128:251109:+ [translate_table: standard]